MAIALSTITISGTVYAQSADNTSVNEDGLSQTLPTLNLDNGGTITVDVGVPTEHNNSTVIIPVNVNVVQPQQDSFEPVIWFKLNTANINCANSNLNSEVVMGWRDDHENNHTWSNNKHHNDRDSDTRYMHFYQPTVGRADVYPERLIINGNLFSIAGFYEGGLCSSEPDKLSSYVFYITGYCDGSYAQILFIGADFNITATNEQFNVACLQ